MHSAAIIHKSSGAKGIKISGLGLAWLVASALWIGGYLYAESLDGLMFQELGEVIPMTILPPLLPPLILAVIVRVLAGCGAP